MLISEKWPREFLNKNTYFVFTAKAQIQGKGQTSNTWTSPIGNVYMTILGEFHANSIPLLSLTVGLATSELLKQYLNLKSGIKWVNDVFVNDKKVSGALIKT
jgi:BirA family biotin operon repressor/biotin-[acetyl-CoA-carboxylase] ligase